MNRSRRWLTALAALAVVANTATAAERRPFTIEQILSSGFPSSLVAAPSGGRVAWVVNVKGERNVWVAETPGYVGRRLTSYSGDEGVDLGQLAWTADGDGVVYVRGGDLEMFRDLPNPANAPEAPPQGIWLAPLAGGAPKLLGTGVAPAVAPKGDRVAYLANGDVWTAHTTGEPRAERLFGAKGGVGVVRWSPDGTKLAFSVGRAAHAFVGVVDVATRSVSYLDPSTDVDGEPVWSPDGSEIAFLRVPTNPQTLIFEPARAGQPWSIRVASVSTGTTRELWRAEAGRGSVYREIVADTQLVWTADGRIVFAWERDGWTHLYALPAAGGAATLLTPGDFEVEHVAATADRRGVVFTSNQGDVDRRHLWRVDVAGGSPRPVTTGTGIEWSPAPTADGRAIAYLCSDARRPAHACVLVGTDRRELAPATIPAEFPSDALVEPQAVVFVAADGASIHGQLFMPPDDGTGKRHPALAFFHGGSRRQMLLGWHYMDYYHNAYAMNQYLASRGYVVLSVNYRSGIGYGMEFREAIDYGARGASEFNDVLGAGLYLKGRADVDPARIGLWGGSYGGYLTALGLARASSLFAAGVDFHGVHDWNTTIQNFVPTYDPVARVDAARLAFASSPLASVDTWRSPVLVVHGDDDRNVPFAETTRLVAELRKRNVEVEQLVLPGETHDFMRHDSWIRAYGATSAFFDRRLGR